MALSYAARVGVVVVAGAACLGALGACDDYDWCIEYADDFGGVPAEGSVDVSVRSELYGDQDVVIDRVVVESVTAEVVEVRGCAHAGGDLYRFNGRFSGFVSGETEVPFEMMDRAARPTFTGELIHCEGGSCVMRAGDGFGFSARGSGVMHAYEHTFEPSSGALDGEFTVSSFTGSVQTTVLVDVTWPEPEP